MLSKTYIYITFDAMFKPDNLRICVLVEMYVCDCVCFCARAVRKKQKRHTLQGQRRVISEPTSRFLLRVTGLIVLVRYSMLIGLILNLWNVCVSSKFFVHKLRSLNHHCVALL